MTNQTDGMGWAKGARYVVRFGAYGVAVHELGYTALAHAPIDEGHPLALAMNPAAPSKLEQFQAEPVGWAKVTRDALLTWLLSTEDGELGEFYNGDVPLLPGLLWNRDVLLGLLRPLIMRTEALAIAGPRGLVELVFMRTASKTAALRLNYPGVDGYVVLMPTAYPVEDMSAGWTRRPATGSWIDVSTRFSRLQLERVEQRAVDLLDTVKRTRELVSAHRAMRAHGIDCGARA